MVVVSARAQHMQSVRQCPAILVVDDDKVLLAVLSRVLTQAGYGVLAAGGVAEALRQPPNIPRLGLLDLSLADGNAVDLARALHARRPDLPLILMTAFPDRLRERPEAAAEFVGVLTKPMDLNHLRQIVTNALKEEPMTQPTPTPHVDPTSTPARPPAPSVQSAFLPEASRVPNRLLKVVQSAGLGLMVVAVLVIFLGFIL